MLGAMTSELRQRLNGDLKQAMRAKDPVALDTIRNVLSAIRGRELESGTELDDANVVKAIRTLIRQREDSIAQYLEGGRADLVERETAEKVLLEGYVPAAPSDAEVERVVGEVMVELQAGSIKDMGKVLKAAQARLGAAVDAKALATVVKSRLQT